jgi:hypothetical protein
MESWFIAATLSKVAPASLHASVVGWSSFAAIYVGKTRSVISGKLRGTKNGGYNGKKSGALVVDLGEMNNLSNSRERVNTIMTGVRDPDK